MEFSAFGKIMKIVQWNESLLYIWKFTLSVSSVVRRWSEWNVLNVVSKVKKLKWQQFMKNDEKTNYRLNHRPTRVFAEHGDSIHQQQFHELSQTWEAKYSHMRRPTSNRSSTAAQQRKQFLIDWWCCVFQRRKCDGTKCSRQLSW